MVSTGPVQEVGLLRKGFTVPSKGASLSSSRIASWLLSPGTPQNLSSEPTTGSPCEESGIFTVNP